jgi:hypothetical protein
MVRIDFNSFINFGPNTLVDALKGLANVYRKNSFLITDGLPAKTQMKNENWRFDSTRLIESTKLKHRFCGLRNPKRKSRVKLKNTFVYDFKTKPVEK